MSAKPQRKPCVTAYDWGEVQKYIEKKYSCNLRDFAGKFGDHGCSEDVEYQDFWHWILDQNDIHNGCQFHLRFGDLSTQPSWVQQIASYIIAEFPEVGSDDGLDLWVDW